MDTKKNRRPVANDQSGDPMSSAHYKGSEIFPNGQTFTPAYFTPLAIVVTEQPEALRGPFVYLFVYPDCGRLIMARPNPNDPDNPEKRGFLCAPEHWNTAACYCIENYGIQRVVMVGGETPEAFREYCNRKGVEVCHA